MEIKGRECEEVKIGKDTLFFLTSFKGKEYRKIMDIQFGADTKIGQDGKFEMNAGKIFAGVPQLFSLFCIDIVRGEEHITPTMEYLDDLEVDSYLKIQDILTSKIGDVVGSKKA